MGEVYYYYSENNNNNNYNNNNNNYYYYYYAWWALESILAINKISNPRLLPNRSPVAWGSQRIALSGLIFHSNTFDFICWAPKFSAFSSEDSFKIFLGISLAITNREILT